MSLALLLTFLAACDETEPCPQVSAEVLGEAGCAWGYDAGYGAGADDGATCTYGRTAIPDASVAMSDDAREVCTRLIASGQTEDTCVANMEANFRACAPGGYSLGYFSNAGPWCACDPDTGAP